MTPWPRIILVTLTLTRRILAQYISRNTDINHLLPASSVSASNLQVILIRGSIQMTIELAGEYRERLVDIPLPGIV